MRLEPFWHLAPKAVVEAPRAMGCVRVRLDSVHADSIDSRRETLRVATNSSSQLVGSRTQ